MRFNRDITMLAIQTYINQQKILKGEKFDDVHFFDALSATGLRALRVSKEISNIRKISCCDLTETAIELIKLNMKVNNIKEDEDKF